MCWSSFVALRTGVVTTEGEHDHVAWEYSCHLGFIIMISRSKTQSFPCLAARSPYRRSIELTEDQSQFLDSMKPQPLIVVQSIGM